MKWVCNFPEFGGLDVRCTPETGGKPWTLHRHCHWEKI